MTRSEDRGSYIGILFFALLIVFPLGTLAPAYPLFSFLFLVCAALAVIFVYSPLLGIIFVAWSSFFYNFNIIFDSPLRVADEIYTFLAVPLCLFLVVILLSNAGNLRIYKLTRSPARKDFFFEGNYDAILLLFLAWSLVSLLWTMDIYHGLNSVYYLLLSFGIYFLCKKVLTSHERFITLVKSLYFFSIILLVMFFLSNQIDEFTFSEELSESLSLSYGLIIYGKRPGGFAPPYYAANIFTFLFFMGCALFTSFGRGGRLCIIALNLAFCVAIFASGSKGASGAFVASVVFYVLLVPPLRKRAFYTVPLSLFIVLILFLFNSFVLGNDRLSTGDEVNQMSATYRLEFWQAGFEMMQHYVFGAGVGGYAWLVDPWPGAHSVYFSTLFDVGIIGGVIIFLFLCTYLFRLRFICPIKAGKNSLLMIYSLLAFWSAFFIHGLVDFSYFVQHVWLFLGLTSAFLNIVEKGQEAVPQKFRPSTNQLSFWGDRVFE